MSPFLVKVFNRLKLLSSLNTSSHIFVDGKKVIIPINGEHGFYVMHLSEPWMTKVLQGLRPVFNGHFVDVGVNMGQTLIKAKAVFNDVQYVGFEPNSTCVHYVQELIKKNNYKNCNLIPVGISDSTSVLKLNFFNVQEIDPSASIIADFRPGEEIKYSTYVPVFDHTHIEGFLPKVKHAILKIDVEGAELEVLRGLKDWVAAYEPIILVEILPIYKEENKSRLDRKNALEQMLLSLGYRFNRIQKNPPVGIVPIDAIGIHTTIDDSDYVVVPGALQQKVLDSLKIK